MRRVPEQERAQIVEGIAGKFRCFGRGSGPRVEGNPIAEALKETEPQFAAGVDVRQVVDYVISQLSGSAVST